MTCVLWGGLNNGRRVLRVCSLVVYFLGNDAVVETGNSGSVFLSGCAAWSVGLREDPIELCFWMPLSLREDTREG